LPPAPATSGPGLSTTPWAGVRCAAAKISASRSSSCSRRRHGVTSRASASRNN